MRGIWTFPPDRGDEMKQPDIIYFTHNETLPKDSEDRHIAIGYFDGAGTNAGIIRRSTAVELSRALLKVWNVDLHDYTTGQNSGSGFICQYTETRKQGS
jgi:hypothetical protein